MTPSILERLKSETRRWHEQVEATVDLPARLNDRQSYAALVARFYGFYVPLERALAAQAELASAGYRLDARRKTPALEQDLRQLGIDPASVPICSDMPDVGSLAASLGCLYVIEGATLGGQIISRLLEQKLTITPASGGAFFSSYGERVGPMWEEFRSVLTHYEAQAPSQTDYVVASAKEAFEKLDAWLATAAK